MHVEPQVETMRTWELRRKTSKPVFPHSDIFRHIPTYSVDHLCVIPSVCSVQPRGWRLVPWTAHQELQICHLCEMLVLSEPTSLSNDSAMILLWFCYDSAMILRYCRSQPILWDFNGFHGMLLLFLHSLIFASWRNPFRQHRLGFGVQLVASQQFQSQRLCKASGFCKS